jgi:phosphoribosyl 1,2-cyclic phosphodiesterase
MIRRENKNAVICSLNTWFKADMKLSIHGCRGSTATSSSITKKYGGNTSCFAMKTDNHQFIFDAGSGFQNINFLTTQVTYLLLSHFHHDHIQGLSFNSQLFDPDNKIIISSDLFDVETVKTTVQEYFSPPYFPIDIFSSLPNIKFLPFKTIQKQLEAYLSLESIPLNHPGGSIGYKLKHKDKSFVYLCDNEFEETQRKSLTTFSKNADLLIWDGMFTEKELASKKGWGHSSIEKAIDFNTEANCKKILITHHAPHRSDKELDQIGDSLPELFTLARDGLEIQV